MLFLSARCQKMTCTCSRQVISFEKIFICPVFEFSNTFLWARVGGWDSWGSRYITDLSAFKVSRKMSHTALKSKLRKMLFFDSVSHAATCPQILLLHLISQTLCGHPSSKSQTWQHPADSMGKAALAQCYLYDFFCTLKSSTSFTPPALLPASARLSTARNLGTTDVTITSAHPHNKFWHQGAAWNWTTHRLTESHRINTLGGPHTLSEVS